MDVLNLTRSSNVGLKGRWMYRVDGKNIVLPTKNSSSGQVTFIAYSCNNSVRRLRC
jgi:hypothetical protein